MYQSFLEKIKGIRIIRNEPERDWGIIFSVLVAFVAVSLGWSVTFFFKNLSDVKASRATVEKNVQSSLGETEVELRSVIELYEAKEAENARVQGGGAVLGDPSIF